MSKVDLHLHTTASDGAYSPEDIVRLAWRHGLMHIAITDHDSVEGVIPAQRAAASIDGINVIAGVEINTDIPSGELHILGYFADPLNPELTDTLERLRLSRVERAEKMVEKLRELGIDVEYRRVRELAGQGSVGRPHIAQAMLEKGAIHTFKEAFDKYIGRNGPAYVERDKISPEEAVQLLLRTGAIPVLAHPLTCEEPEKRIGQLKEAGLQGLEAYYGEYGPDQVALLVRLAASYGLITTGGSDFHGLNAVAEPALGITEVPLKCAEKLIEYHSKFHLVSQDDHTATKTS